MPKYLDSHPMQNSTFKELKKLQKEPKDEFGVTHIDIICCEEKDRMYCFLEAPDKEAVEKHHEKFGYKCDFIIEVNSTAHD